MSQVALAKQQPVKRKKAKIELARIIGFLVLLIVTVAMIMPLGFMLSTSLKTTKEMLVFPPTVIPEHFAWENFKELFVNSEIKFGRQYMNSLIVAIATVIGTVFSSSFVAFGFARYRARGSQLLFVLVLSTLMLPYPAIMIPQFLLFTKLGLHDSLLPLILPSFFASAYMIFLLKQFFATIPNELYDAGRMDGCREVRLYWSLTLPLSGPVLATVAIFSFIWSWNDLLAPVLYLDSQENFTLPIGMAAMLSSKFRIAPWNLMMAASLLSVLPIVVLFAIAQKRFVQGIVLTGIK
ncbi:carbohydrate ABC transporter permease [Cohnella cholangitidis]|uniref:Carbohydrate ABC transporter permease n=1 Tax=Cohnella cholangitidis TaxID=2598458 RepID=A0A7G5BY18_9BACL|nr:carbohydrate ABC transporter permease [Cohnella cholangitidis]QMV41852.1 carbohydrate ABC transporter permease [Cohnella cholangitidis]